MDLNQTLQLLEYITGEYLFQSTILKTKVYVKEFVGIHTWSLPNLWESSSNKLKAIILEWVICNGFQSRSDRVWYLFGLIYVLTISRSLQVDEPICFRQTPGINPILWGHSSQCSYELFGFLQVYHFFIAIPPISMDSLYRYCTQSVNLKSLWCLNSIELDNFFVNSDTFSADKLINNFPSTSLYAIKM